jgi:hypothetical protein
VKTHITLEDLQAWDACYLYDGRRDLLRDLFAEPVSVIDILTRTDGAWACVSLEDRLWVVLRSDVLPDRILRLFACACAERALDRERAAGREPDPSSIEAVAIARRYADGQATRSDLRAACIRAAAYAVANAARAATSVARAASAAAAADAADAATSAARAAAAAAAADAAIAAADAARAATSAARAANTTAAKAAAADAERSAQVADLINLIKAEGAAPC